MGPDNSITRTIARTIERWDRRNKINEQASLSEELAKYLYADRFLYHLDIDNVIDKELTNRGIIDGS